MRPQVMFVYSTNSLTVDPDGRTSIWDSEDGGNVGTIGTSKQTNPHIYSLVSIAGFCC